MARYIQIASKNCFELKLVIDRAINLYSFIRSMQIYSCGITHLDVQPDIPHLSTIWHMFNVSLINACQWKALCYVPDSPGSCTKYCENFCLGCRNNWPFGAVDYTLFLLVVNVTTICIFLFCLTGGTFKCTHVCISILFHTNHWNPTSSLRIGKLYKTLRILIHW